MRRLLLGLTLLFLPGCITASLHDWGYELHRTVEPASRIEGWANEEARVELRVHYRSGETKRLTWVLDPDPHIHHEPEWLRSGSSVYRWHDEPVPEGLVELPVHAHPRPAAGWHLVWPGPEHEVVALYEGSDRWEELEMVRDFDRVAEVGLYAWAEQEGTVLSIATTWLLTPFTFVLDVVTFPFQVIILIIVLDNLFP